MECELNTLGIFGWYLFRISSLHVLTANHNLIIIIFSFLGHLSNMCENNKITE